jgi:hypothetical protein
VDMQDPGCSGDDAREEPSRQIDLDKIREFFHRILQSCTSESSLGGVRLPAGGKAREIDCQEFTTGTAEIKMMEGNFFESETAKQKKVRYCASRPL